MNDLVGHMITGEVTGRVVAQGYDSLRGHWITITDGHKEVTLVEQEDQVKFAPIEDRVRIVIEPDE